MPANPKYEQFHSVKVVSIWWKSTDHEQNQFWRWSWYISHAFSKKCLETSNFTIFTKPKWCQKNSTDCNWDLTSPQGGQDTSACQNSGIFTYAFSWKCQKTSILSSFTKSKCRQKKENQQIMMVVRIHQHTNFQVILPMSSQENAQKLIGMGGQTNRNRVVRHPGNGQWVNRSVSQTDRQMDKQKDRWTEGQPNWKHNPSGTKKSMHDNIQ